MQEMQSTSLIVDRIEGTIAVCETVSASIVDVPLSDLPEGTKEGSVLRLENGSYVIDAEEERSRRSRIESKAKRLFI